MLGLSSGLTHPDYIAPDIEQPTDISGLIGWWDFTDSSTMYTDAGSTNVSSNDEGIYRIDNKAYTLQANDTSAIGQFLQQPTEDDRPLFRTGESLGENNKSFAFFYQDAGTESMNMFAHSSVGNTVSGKLSTATYDNDAQTIFCVYHITTRVPSRMNLFGLYGHDYDSSSGLLERYKTHGQLQYRILDRSDTDGDGDVDTNDEYRPELEMKKGSNNGTGPESRIWDTVGTGAELEASVKFRYDTIVVDGQAATTTSQPYLRPGRLYKNGDDSNGIGPSYKTDVSDDTDETVNLGLDGTISPFAVQIGAYLSTSPLFSTYLAANANFTASTKLYEIIYYNKVLNAEEIAGVHSYIESKYGEPPY